MKYFLLPHTYTEMRLSPKIGRQIPSDRDMLKKCICLRNAHTKNFISFSTQGKSQLTPGKTQHLTYRPRPSKPSPGSCGWHQEPAQGEAGGGDWGVSPVGGSIQYGIEAEKNSFHTLLKNLSCTCDKLHQSTRKQRY